MHKSKASTRGKDPSAQMGDNSSARPRHRSKRKEAAEPSSTLHRELVSMIGHATIEAITAAIAHDVHQPLAAMVTSANAAMRWLARPQPDVEEARALLRRIVDEGHRAGEMITGIRSRFAVDKDATAVDLEDVIAQVLAFVAAELESRAVSVRMEIPQGLPAVTAERGQLQLAFLSLIANAIEAMDTITQRDRVLTIASRLDGSGHLLVTLEDTGTGIDPSHLDRIFEAFFTTKSQRAGLGLSICRKIIESHGGRLWAAARHPHGTAFFVKLPLLEASGGGPSGARS
jgi:signal transduction histidine kinase